MNNIINILLSKLFSRCPDCKKWFKHDVKNRKLNTRYENDKYNYLYSCEDCYYEVCRYYNDLARRYHRFLCGKYHE